MESERLQDLIEAHKSEGYIYIHQQLAPNASLDVTWIDLYPEADANLDIMLYLVGKSDLVDKDSSNDMTMSDIIMSLDSTYDTDEIWASDWIEEEELAGRYRFRIIV